MAHAIDLYPTIAAAAGLEAPKDLAGINLLDEGALRKRKTVFGVTHSIHNMTRGDPDDTLQYLWCVEGDWKLLLRLSGVDTTNYKNVHIWDTKLVSLFDLKEDPHGKEDVADRHPEVVERLKRRIEDWRRSLRD